MNTSVTRLGLVGLMAFSMTLPLLGCQAANLEKSPASNPSPSQETTTMPTAAVLTIGQPAPNFTLSNQDGQPITLSDFHGQWVVVFFYPKDQTPGCTQQACQLRDKLTQWEKQLPEQYPGTRVQVLGISGDSVSSHKAFADKYKLTYPLLADEGNRVRTLWGVPKTMGMLPGRVTYLLDPQGVVREIFNSQMDIAGHIAAMDAALTQALSNPTTVSKMKTSAVEHTQP